MFFKAIGMLSRAFDVLNKASICLTQRWAERTMNRISADRMKTVVQRMEEFAVVLSGDNVNYSTRIFTTRIHNQNSFGSGTTATAFITPRPPFSPEVAGAFRNLAREHPTLVHKDLINPEASRRILEVLLSSPNFAKYSPEHIAHPLLQPPPPHRLAPTGKDNVTQMFLTSTIILSNHPSKAMTSGLARC